MESCSSHSFWRKKCALDLYWKCQEMGARRKRVSTIQQEGATGKSSSFQISIQTNCKLSGAPEDLGRPASYL
jgi:hypothetical protein